MENTTNQKAKAKKAEVETTAETTEGVTAQAAAPENNNEPLTLPLSKTDKAATKKPQKWTPNPDEPEVRDKCVVAVSTD